MFLRAAIIIVLGFLAYASMLNSPFRVMDDRISIINNTAIKSFKNIPGIFQEGFFHDQEYYRPLVNMSFMAEYHFFGLHSFFYNLDNLLLHIFNAFLVLALVTRLTGNSSVGFWVALLFLLHPVQWEAVCNVSGRAILLASFFTVSSFILFLDFYKQQRIFNLVWVLVLFFLGLLCKESAAMLPLVLTAYLATEKKIDWNKKIIYLWPFAAGILAYIVLRKYFGITDVSQSSHPSIILFGFLTFLRSLITDLRLLVFPIGLHYDASLPYMISWQEPRLWGTCLFWAAVGIGIFMFRWRMSLFTLFLMGWFALEMLPVSQLVSSIGVGAGYISAAEHFLYMACIPFLIGLVMLFQWAYAQHLLKTSILKCMALGFLMFLFLASVEQSVYASNEFNMVGRSLSIDPFNPRLQCQMGMLYVFRHDIPGAEEHFRAAAKLEPLNPRYHVALASALCQQGKWIEGLEQFVVFEPIENKASVLAQEQLTMGHIQDQLNAGKTFDARGWLAIGIYEANKGDSDAAIKAFEKTLQLNPNQTDALFNLASIAETHNDLQKARMYYQQLLRLQGITPFQKDFALKHLAQIQSK